MEYEEFKNWVAEEGIDLVYARVHLDGIIGGDFITNCYKNEDSTWTTFEYLERGESHTYVRNEDETFDNLKRTVEINLEYYRTDCIRSLRNGLVKHALNDEDKKNMISKMFPNNTSTSGNISVDFQLKTGWCLLENTGSETKPITGYFKDRFEFGNYLLNIVGADDSEFQNFKEYFGK